jgi:hypothetical protein
MPTPAWQRCPGLLVNVFNSLKMRNDGFDWSQPKAAKKLQIKVNTLRSHEKGYRNPNPDHQAAYVKVYQIPESELAAQRWKVPGQTSIANAPADKTNK